MWDRWDLLPGSTRQCSMQAGRHCTQPQEPETTFDAPLAPEANEITAGGMELNLSLTDLQIPSGQNTGEKAVKPIICGVNYTRLGTTCLVQEIHTPGSFDLPAPTIPQPPTHPPTYPKLLTHPHGSVHGWRCVALALIQGSHLFISCTELSLAF